MSIREITETLPNPIFSPQVVGVLEDGRTYATELVQSRKPREGAVAQWEHEVVCLVCFMCCGGWRRVPMKLVGTYMVEPTDVVET